MKKREPSIEFPDRHAYKRRQRSNTWIVLSIVGIVVAALAVWFIVRDVMHRSQRPPPPVAVPRPAPKPVPKPPPPDPAVTRAVRMAAIREAMLRGDEVGMQKQVDALQDDFRKSMRFVDAARVADYDAARREAWDVEGVRSLAWMDRVNLYAIVDEPARRNQTTIDAICKAMDALGDPPDVVVALQVDFRGQEESDLLSRNCRIAAPAAEETARTGAAGARKPAGEAGKAPADDADAQKDPVRENSLRILRDTTPEM